MNDELVSDLLAENDRLKALVKSAFYEGYTKGFLDETEHAMNRWQSSEARAAMEGREDE